MKLLITLIFWQEYPIDGKVGLPKIFDLGNSKQRENLIIAFGNGVIGEMRAEGDSAKAIQYLNWIIRGPGACKPVALSLREKEILWLYKEGYDCYFQEGDPPGYIFVNPIPQPQLFNDIHKEQSESEEGQVEPSIPAKRGEITKVDEKILGGNINLISIVTALRRLQQEGGGGENNFIILVADQQKNYYIQFAGERGNSKIYAEAVGNEVLSPEYKLGQRQIAHLLSLGWEEPRYSPNYCRNWITNNDAERRTVAYEVMRTFIEVYQVRPDKVIDVELELGN